jgi:MFS family permease
MPHFKAVFDPISPTLQGLIVSSILLPASISSFLAGPVSDRISRKYTFALGSAIFCAGAALECAAINLPMLFVGRCISGVGEGLFFSTATVYVAEIAPAATRGRLLAVQQLLVTIGLASGLTLRFRFRYCTDISKQGFSSPMVQSTFPTAYPGVFLLACKPAFLRCSPLARTSSRTRHGGFDTLDVTKKPFPHGHASDTRPQKQKRKKSPQSVANSENIHQLGHLARTRRTCGRRT